MFVFTPLCFDFLLSSEVINEGSSCFHMKFSRVFFVFVVSGVVFLWMIMRKNG